MQSDFDGCNSSQREMETTSSSPLIQQLNLLYQLEQRKVFKLENENRSLRDRISNLLSKHDDERIDLLVSDKTMRKLTQIKAITERTIKSLESGLNEFRSFVNDIEEAVEEEERCGAIKSAKINTPSSLSAAVIPMHERLLDKFQPSLKRIPESPMIRKTLTSRRRAMVHQIDEREFDAVDENDTVEETHFLDDQQRMEHCDNLVGEHEKRLENDGGIDREIVINDDRKHLNGVEDSLNSFNANRKVANNDQEPKEDKEHEVLDKEDKNSIIDETVNEVYGERIAHPREENREDKHKTDASTGSCVKTEIKEAEKLKLPKSKQNSIGKKGISEQSASDIVIVNNGNDNNNHNNSTCCSSSFRTAATTPILAEMCQFQNNNISQISRLTNFSFPAPSATSTPMSSDINSIDVNQPKRKRMAASKVQSYKLPALNKKMRREE